MLFGPKEFWPFRNNYLIYVILLFGMISPSIIPAQLSVEPAILFTPESLIENVFLGDGVAVTNITYAGSNQAVGLFGNGQNDIGLESGIVMSTGRISEIDQNSSNTADSSPFGAANNDVDLTAIAGAGVRDVAVYTISFIPTSDTLRFRFVFASEEYPEFACSDFNDVFGFFISGPGINGPYSNNAENIALVPDPIDPTGLTFTNVPVTINNVNASGIDITNGCLYDYSEYYNTTNSNSFPVFDAYLDVFIAQAIVTPCLEYTIKLALADKDDDMLDTGVFLEAKSFGTSSLNVEITTLSLDGTITENCLEGQVTFSLPQPISEDFVIDYNIFGDAVNGIDYEFIPSDLAIPAGDSTISISINGFEDGIFETTESICFDVQRDVCNRDTFCIYIRDNTILPPNLASDTTICSGDGLQLDATLPIILPEPPIFTNGTNFPIATISNNDPPGGNPPTISEINVFGVPPPFLQDGVVKSVCVNIDHPWTSDLDFFLFSPGGQFMELSTDNGGSGNDYTNTCFTPNATDPINFGSQAPNTAPPFTGNWTPEGDWDFLWNSANPPPTNGTWQLQIKDDQSGFNGNLLDWSICFNPIYQVQYDWMPVEGLSCSDCPNPFASPTSTTTYTVVATDSYGCTVSDQINIDVASRLEAPDVACGVITDNSIDFNWNNIGGAASYEVSVNGGPWLTSLNTQHLVSGLTLNDSVSLEVRALGMCTGEIGSQMCFTPSCVPPTINMLISNPASCEGIENASLEIIASGSNPIDIYTIQELSLSNTTGVFNNIPSGNYTVQVLDQANCPAYVQVVIGVLDSMVSSPEILNEISCIGVNEGLVTTGITGGSWPYTFNWNNSITDSIAGGLLAGWQYVTVTDFAGCLVMDSIFIDQPDSLLIHFSTDNVSCNGESDGVATAIATGGSGNYSYQWDAFADLQNTQSATDLSAGSYSVLVIDDNGCLESAVVEVMENDSITLMSNGVDVSCYMGTDGTANVMAIGGTGIFTYSWNDPLNQSGSHAINLSANLYEVIVTDSDGCSKVKNVLVNEPPEIQLSTDIDSASCFNTFDGSGGIIVSGGIGPYNFDWPQQSGMVNDSVYYDLASGSYVTTVTDANGCRQEITLEIPSPEALVVDFAVLDITCSGDSTGSATVNVNGGVAPFSYQWDIAANNQISQTAIDLPIGNYGVVITDANNCSLSETVDIGESLSLNVEINVDDVACFGENTGNIDLQVNGGNPGYIFEWTGPNAFSSNDEDLLAITAGQYLVRVTDAGGCIDTQFVDVIQPATPITSSMSIPDSVCNGAINGQATVIAIGGSGDLTYGWSNGSNSNNASGLMPGLHTVSILDENNCMLMDTAFVFERPAYSMMIAQNGPLCHNGNDASASITAINYGGVNIDPAVLIISWPDLNQMGINANFLSGGSSYVVELTDEFSCSATENILIDNPEEISILLNNTINISCFDGNDGLIDVQANGGTAPYQYTWEGLVDPPDTNLIQNLVAGTYFLTITDANSCSTLSPYVLSQPSEIITEFEIKDLDCSGQRTGSISTIVDGGTGPFNFLWSNGSDEAVLDQIPAGNYYLTLTDAKGCIHEDIASVESPNSISAEIQIVNVTCFGGFDGKITITPMGGLPPYTYSIDGENFNGLQSIVGLVAGDYPIYIKDANDCVAFIEEVEITQPGDLIVDLGEDIEIRLGENVTLEPQITNARGNESDWIYEWDINDSIYLNCIDCSSARVRDLQFANTFEIKVTDAAGCVGEDRIIVFVRKIRDLHVPSGFSPNQDGQNDLLLVHGREKTRILHFQVYDRWGELLYEASDFDANDPDVGWNGQFRNEKMPAGVYVWRAEVEFEDGGQAFYKGHTTLIR